MSRIPKLFVKLAIIASLTVISAFLVVRQDSWDKAWRFDGTELAAENAELTHENELLELKIADLEEENANLKKYLLAYETNLIALRDAAAGCGPTEPGPAVELPEGLRREPIETRRIYRDLLSEAMRWNQYQQEQYKHIIDSTVEPHIVEAQTLYLENEDNREYFLELEYALKLHRRLIRDVRLFHDEIQYQKAQHRDQMPYQLFDLKFKLAPFARESALVDALQQAMSAMSAGVYQTEAEEVLDRIGEELTKPIRLLYEQQEDTTESPVASKYNYNLYSVYGRKLMDYSETLARQSSITLGPSAFGQLDYFNRRLYDSLYDLYQLGQDDAIDPSNLDLAELEEVLDAKF